MKLKALHLVLGLSFGLASTVSAQIDPGPNPGDTSSVSFSYNNKTITHKTVRGKDKKVWLQQNLGSSRVANDTKDIASYGDYFQWGRWDDGHQIKTGAVADASTLSANNPSGLKANTGKFYTNWWNAGKITDSWTNNPPTIENGLDPCAAIGPGWRMPTIKDWTDFIAAEKMKDDTASAFKTTLKLVPSGYRDAKTGAPSSLMSEGSYWSSTNRSATSANILQFTSGASPFGVGNFMARVNGFCIRCVKICQLIDSVKETICFNESFIRPNGAVAKESGVYMDIVGVTGAGCDSVVITNLTVLPEMKPLVITGDDTVCAGSNYIYEVPSAPGISTYVWKASSGWTGNSDSSSVNLTAGVNAGPGEISVYAVNECGDTSATTTYQVYVSAPKAIISIDKFELSVNGNFASYQWYQDGQSIANATNSTYTVTSNGVYTVKVTDGAGCTDSSDIYSVTNITGIEDINAIAKQIKVYPNPVHDFLNILSPVKIEVTLTDIAGRFINKTSTDPNRIAVNELAEGVYLLHISDKSGRLLKVEKFIKTK